MRVCQGFQVYQASVQDGRGVRGRLEFVCNISQRPQITFKQQYKHKFMIIHEPDPLWEN